MMAVRCFALIAAGAVVASAAPTVPKPPTSASESAAKTVKPPPTRLAPLRPDRPTLAQRVMPGLY